MGVGAFIHSAYCLLVRRMRIFITLPNRLENLTMNNGFRWNYHLIQTMFVSLELIILSLPSPNPDVLPDPTYVWLGSHNGIFYIRKLRALKSYIKLRDSTS